MNTYEFQTKNGIIRKIRCSGYYLENGTATFYNNTNIGYSAKDRGYEIINEVSECLSVSIFKPRNTDSSLGMTSEQMFPGR